MQPLADELATLGLAGGWLDGEIVVLDDRRRAALQRAAERASTSGAARGHRLLPVRPAVLRRPRPARSVPLRSAPRGAAAACSGASRPNACASATSSTRRPSVVASACRMGLEGVIAKRRDSRLRVGRSTTGSSSSAAGARSSSSAATPTAGDAHRDRRLLLGVHADGAAALRGQRGHRLGQRGARPRRHCGAGRRHWPSPAGPALALVKRRPASEHWVAELVAEVAFGEWTPRRPDPPCGLPWATRGQGCEGDHARRRRRRRAKAAAKRAPGRRPPPGAEPQPCPRTWVSNPERVIDARAASPRSTWCATTSVAPLHAAAPQGRARCRWCARPGRRRRAVLPEARREQHARHRRSWTRRCGPGQPPMLEVATAEALRRGRADERHRVPHLELASSRTIDKPDRMIFDLDPGEGVTGRISRRRRC